MRRFFRIFVGVCLGSLLVRLTVSHFFLTEPGEEPVFNRMGGYLGEFYGFGAGKFFLFFTLGVWAVSFVPRVDRFITHAVMAMGALGALNWMISHDAPLAIEQIGASYLIFFYHFPSAINCFVFFALVMLFSVAYLRTRDPLWDRCARVAGEVGLMVCTIVLVTGSTWAKAAWNQWWVWDDPRLMSAAVMWLTYAGYVMLQYQMEDPARRQRYAAVFGILAFVNIPIVHFSIRWFGGEVSHPMKFSDLSSDHAIIITRWYGVLAFLLFYSLVYRWKLAREATHHQIQASLTQVRRIEEGAHA